MTWTPGRIEWCSADHSTTGDGHGNWVCDVDGTTWTMGTPRPRHQHRATTVEGVWEAVTSDEGTPCAGTGRGWCYYACPSNPTGTHRLCDGTGSAPPAIAYTDTEGTG